MSDTKSFKAQLTKKDLHKKGIYLSLVSRALNNRSIIGQISGRGNEGPIGSSGKRRGLGFQDQQ